MGRSTTLNHRQSRPAIIAEYLREIPLKRGKAARGKRSTYESVVKVLDVQFFPADSESLGEVIGCVVEEEMKEDGSLCLVTAADVLESVRAR